jgi:Cu-processing system permease protein
MMLLLTYPVKRWQVIIGKFMGHVMILFIAITVGYGGTILVMILLTGISSEGWQAYVVMMATSLLLGAVFIALGYLVSVLVKERATAAGAAVGLWLLFVVVYDLMLFGVLVLDEGQVIGQQLFSVLMLVSPTDTYRILNLSMFEGVSEAAGIASAVSEAQISGVLLSGVMLLWVLLPLTAALAVFQRREL